MLAELKEIIFNDSIFSKTDFVEGKIRVGGEAMIGPKGEAGAEIFSFSVVSTCWFAKEKDKLPILARGLIVVDYFDGEQIRAYLVKIISGVSGSTWEEMGASLNRFLVWEFDDYYSIEK